MSQKSIELRQKRATLIQEMHDLTEKTSFEGESKTRWQAVDAEVKALMSQIEAVESTENLRAELAKTNHKELSQPGDMHKDEVRTFKSVDEVRADKGYEQRFDTYLRNFVPGRNLASQNELRTYAGMNVGTGTSGGDLVPIGFQKTLEIKTKAYGGMRNVCQIINTSTGNNVDYPTMDDTANVGEWLAEAGAVGQVNPSFGQIVLKSNVLSSKQVLVSVQLLQDSAFDVQDMLTTAFAIRLGRKANNGYTLGNGSGAPLGILDATNGVPGFGSGSQIVAAVGDSQSGNTATNSVGTDDFAGLIEGLDDSYRQNASFMGNVSTFDFARKLKDSLGRPLWEASLTAGVPDTIYGYKWVKNFDMPAIGTSAYSLLFGDFSKYVIRDTGPIEVFIFQETYMTNLQKGFLAYQRTDGQLLQGAAFTVLQNAS